MSRINDGTPCARCGEPAEGFATIDGERYCHGDSREATCYMRESWDRSSAANIVRLKELRILAALDKPAS